MSCAAALAVQRVIERDQLLDNVGKMGTHLKRRLDERFGNNPYIGDVRGRGLFWAWSWLPTALRKSRSIPRSS